MASGSQAHRPVNQGSLILLCFPLALFSDWQTWQTTVTGDSETAVKPVYFSYTDPLCSVDYSES